MTLRIVFRRAAKSEFERAALWYDEKRTGLGEEFIREIDEALAKAAAAPQRHPLYSVIFDALLRVAFHLPSTFVCVQTRWLSSQCFTGAEILPSGNVGYDRAIDSDAWQALFALAGACHRGR
jgi:hypothetical protein